MNIGHFGIRHYVRSDDRPDEGTVLGNVYKDGAMTIGWFVVLWKGENEPRIVPANTVAIRQGGERKWRRGNA